MMMKELVFVTGEAVQISYRVDTPEPGVEQMCLGAWLD